MKTKCTYKACKLKPVFGMRGGKKVRCASHRLDKHMDLCTVEQTIIPVFESEEEEILFCNYLWEGFKQSFKKT